MRKSTVFIVISLGFIIGVLVGSVHIIEKPWLYVAAAFCVGVFALTYYNIDTNPDNILRRTGISKIVRYLSLGLMFLCIGIWRIQDARAVPNQFTGLFNNKIDMEGVIVEEPDVRPDKQLLTIQLGGYEQRVLITTTQYYNYAYGDRVWMRGKLVEPKQFDDFDYRGYLERQNVYALLRYPKLVVLKTGEGNSIKSAILRIKTAAVSRISTIVEKPYSDLLLGILVGARKGLPPEVNESFIVTGTSHIVAVSGFNMSVIILALAYMARFIGRRLSFWLSLLIIFIFTIMAGASPSVIRAAIMGLLVLIAMNIGRLYAIIPSLLCAAVIMLLINPKILYWDVGFQLSFAATIGIVVGVPVLMRLTQFVPNDFGIKSALLVTVAASLATLPLTLFAFDRMSVIAPLVNVLVLPFIPLVMLLGVCILAPFIGVGFGFVTQKILEGMLIVIDWASRIPHASVSFTISAITFWSLVCALCCLYGILWYAGRRIPEHITVDVPRVL